jgi:ribosomal protein S17E
VVIIGRIRTKDVKDLARDIHEAHRDKFGSDFEQNKASLNELKIVEGRSKRFRNRVAGYIVRVAGQKPKK